MKSTRALLYVIGAITMLLCTSHARAGMVDPNDEIAVQASVYNMHYHYDPEHLRYSPLIGVEVRKPSGWLYGGALFLNSFGQFCQLAYGGYLMDVPRTDLYAKIIAGVLHGYDGIYRDKVPFNHQGFSPGIIPAIGYRYGRARFEVQFLWTSGLMATVGTVF
jgi:hypothetical protein